jgi:hypothetical protein
MQEINRTEGFNIYNQRPFVHSSNSGAMPDVTHFMQTRLNNLTQTPTQAPHHGFAHTIIPIQMVNLAMTADTFDK